MRASSKNTAALSTSRLRRWSPTSPKSASKSSFSRPLVYTACRRIPASSGTNRGEWKRRVAPTLRASSHHRSSEAVSAARYLRTDPRRNRAHKEQLLYRNVQRFRGGLVFKAHRLLYQSTLGLRVIKKKKSRSALPSPVPGQARRVLLFFFITLKPRVE